MISTKRTVLSACLMLATTLGFAQTQTREGLNNMQRSAISPIFEGSEVKGYLLFYKADRADKKNDNYSMDIYDQDLNEAKSVTITKPRNSMFMLENTFNGSVLGFYFYNIKEKSLEIETYDTSLNKIASKKIKEVSKMDNMLIQQELQKGATAEPGGAGLNLYAVPGKGFVRNSFEGLGKGYMVEMFDNNLQTKWKFATDKNSKKYETIGITEVTDKYVLATVVRRDGLMSKKMDFFMVAFDIETGKKVMDKNIEGGSKDQLSMSSFNYDKEKNEFVSFGEYYKPEARPTVDRSLGFYVKKYSVDGKETASKFYSWEKDVKAKLPAAAKESVEKGFVNYTHNIVKGADGKTYIIAEQFKINADGWGIAAKMAGAKSANLTKAVVANMMVFVVNPDMALSEIKFYAKDKSEVSLPDNIGMQSSGVIGGIMKSAGKFDYQFLQKTNDGSNFNVVYVNYDKEKGEGTKKVVGNVMVGAEGNFSQDKIDVTSKSTKSFIYPGKAGYLMIVDFAKKEKKMDMKLVKLNG